MQQKLFTYGKKIALLKKLTAIEIIWNGYTNWIIPAEKCIHIIKTYDVCEKRVYPARTTLSVQKFHGHTPIGPVLTVETEDHTTLHILYDEDFQRHKHWNFLRPKGMENPWKTKPKQPKRPLKIWEEIVEAHKNQTPLTRHGAGNKECLVYEISVSQKSFKLKYKNSNREPKTSKKIDGLYYKE